MEKSLLTLMIFDTDLISRSFLTEKEQLVIRRNIKDNKSFLEISKEIGVTNERVRQILKDATSKIIVTIKDVLAKASLLEASAIEKKHLEFQIKQLKDKFKKELLLEQSASIRIKPLYVSINEIKISERAKKILRILNIFYTKDFANLTRQALNSVDGAGVKTVEHIIYIAAEYGFKII